MIAVRQFEEGDAQALASTMKEMVSFYGKPLAVAGSLSEDIIRQSKAIFIAVALSDDRLAGFATFGFLYPVAGLRSFAYLQQIYVASEFRRLGVAQKLMAFVARTCLDHGCTWMEWTTGQDNTAAQTFYEGLGATAVEKVGYELTGAALNKLASAAE
jgi:GNAT superfamily N-acetyltransferase